MIQKVFGLSTTFIKAAIKYHFIRYAIVGVISAAIEWGLLVFFVEVFKMSYLNGNVIAFSLVMVINYVLSRKWVFQSSGNKKRVEFPVFLFFVACGFAINQFALWYFVSQAGMHYEIAKIIAIFFVVIWNFFTRRFIVFKKLIPVSEETES